MPFHGTPAKGLRKRFLPGPDPPFRRLAACGFQPFEIVSRVPRNRVPTDGK